MFSRRAVMIALVAGCLFAVGGCKGSSGDSVKLNGAGATFPEPLYNRWFADYRQAHSNVSINYNPMGSGGGINQLTQKTVDFAASDAAMTDEEISKVEGGVILLPVTAGSIVLAYNIPGVSDHLRLSREAYTGIFLGKITKWNDPAIAKTNDGVQLPDLKITPVQRADGSGTTFVFTQHLSAISPEFKSGPGVGKSVNWPQGGIASKGTAGIAATIRQTEGTIGYMEEGYVKQAKLMVAALENKDGNFVVADEKSGKAALSSIAMPDNLIAWGPDPAGKDSYPIVTYTWLLAYKTYADPAKAKALKDVIRYGLTEGQKVSPEMGYIPLPEEVVKKVQAAADAIQP